MAPLGLCKRLERHRVPFWSIFRHPKKRAPHVVLSRSISLGVSGPWIYLLEHCSQVSYFSKGLQSPCSKWRNAGEKKSVLLTPGRLNVILETATLSRVLYMAHRVRAHVFVLGRESTCRKELGPVSRTPFMFVGWETCYIFAYGGLVVEIPTELLKLKFCSPSNVNQVLGGCSLPFFAGEHVP